MHGHMKVKKKKMRVIQNNNRGIGWGLHGRLEDLDYAYIVCLRLQSYRGMSEKICNLQAGADTARLKINSKKPKELWINSKIITNICIDIVIERVEQYVSGQRCNGGRRSTPKCSDTGQEGTWDFRRIVPVVEE